MTLLDVIVNDPSEWDEFPRYNPKSDSHSIVDSLQNVVKQTTNEATSTISEMTSRVSETTPDIVQKGTSDTLSHVLDKAVTASDHLAAVPSSADDSTTLLVCALAVSIVLLFACLLVAYKVRRKGIGVLLALLTLCTTNAIGATFRDYAWRQYIDYPFRDGAHVAEDDSTCLVWGTIGSRLGKAGVAVPMYVFGGEAQDVTVGFRYRTVHCDSLAVTLSSLSDDNKVLHADTIVLTHDGEWHDFSHHYEFRQGQFLNITIAARGENDKNVGELSMAGFCVESDGRLLRQEDSPFPASEYDAAFVSHFDTAAELPFMNQKILSLGESVHGTETLQRTAFSIMRERILYHGCRLVMMELPIDYGLIVNRYIKNDERFLLEDVTDYRDLMLYDEAFVEFVQWLKSYNQEHRNEVSFVGMDHFDNFLSSLYECKFLDRLNSQRDESIKELCHKILQFRNSGISGGDVEQCAVLSEVMTEEEYILFKYCLDRLPLQTLDLWSARDKVMHEVAELAISCHPSAAVTLHGHIMHLNYSTMDESRGILNCPSMGSLMRERYGTDYSCVALLTKGGEAKGKGNEGTTYHLQEPPVESIEYQTGKARLFPAYVSLQEEVRPIKMRSVGNFQRQHEFFYISPCKYIDAAILEENVQPQEASTPTARNAFTLPRYINLLSEIQK